MITAPREKRVQTAFLAGLEKIHGSIRAEILERFLDGGDLQEGLEPKSILTQMSPIGGSARIVAHVSKHQGDR